VDTVITSVVVYPDRARLTRRGSIKLKMGLHRVEISDLSILLEPESARVSARGNVPTRLVGFQLQKRFYQQTPAEYVRELENQYESANDELDRLDAGIDLVNSQSTRLSDLAGHTAIYARAIARAETTVDKQLELFSALRKRREQLEEEAQNLHILKREQVRKIEKLKKQLDQVQSTKPRERYAAVVEIEVMQEGEISIDMIYMVRLAGWEPIYDFRLVEGAGDTKVELDFLAQIKQNTGENWGGVALTLSTARPALNSILPDLDPWYVGPLPTPYPRVMARVNEAAVPSSMLSAAAAEIREAEEPEMFEAEYATAGVESAWTAVSYQVPGKVVIPSDGEPHKVTIARLPLNPETDYICAPRVAQAVYRRAQVLNDSPLTLLPGSANLFAGDEYIGTTRLEMTPPQGEIDLYLGVDDRVVVRRELKKRLVDKALIGGKRRIHYAFQIELENHTGRDISLTLKDQIPVSRHEDLKVKLNSVEPKPATQDELNILEWGLSLAPEGKTVVRYDFDVEHPVEMNVGGLP